MSSEAPTRSSGARRRRASRAPAPSAQAQPRVVHLINGLEYGGGERLLCDLVAATPEVESSVYVLTRLGALTAELEQLGVPVRKLGWRGLPLPWRFAVLVRELAAADVLHTSFFLSDLAGAVLARAGGARRLVSTRHETGFWMRRWHRAVEPWVYRRFDQVLCVSRAVAASLEARGVDARKLRVVEPGVSLPEAGTPRPEVAAPGRDGAAAPEPAGSGGQEGGVPGPDGAAGAHVGGARGPDAGAAALILSVGRLEEVKGHDVLLEALALLAARDDLPPWRAVVAGEGSQGRRLRAQAARLRLSERCRFAGAVPRAEVRRLLGEAALFCLPSRSEGLPVSALEAMAAGVPVVATRVGGVPEIVRDGETGVLVPPEEPAALAAALARALEEPDASSAMTTAAREVAGEHGLARFVAAHREAWGSANASRPATFDVCMLVRNEMRVDSRVEREAGVLAAHGRNVVVLAQGGDGLPRREQREGFAIERLTRPPGAEPSALRGVGAARGGEILAMARAGLSRALTRARAARTTASFYAGSVARIWAHRPAVVHSNDLDTLLPGWLGAALVGARLVYDSHELWTERNIELGAVRRRLDRIKYGSLERLLIRRAHHVMTVSEGIADELARRYGIRRPTVLRNVPAEYGGVERSLRARVGGTGPILLYLGIIDPNRGLEEIVRALPGIPGARLVLMGPARERVLAELERLAREQEVADRLIHLPPVPRAEIVSWAREADVGLCLYRAVCLSHTLCLPNKLFEYAFAGVPVVASDLPELSAWVGKHRLGVTCDPDDPAAIAAAVNSVLAGEVALASARERAEFRARFRWQREAEKLLAIYGHRNRAGAATRGMDRRGSDERARP